MQINISVFSAIQRCNGFSLFLPLPDFCYYTMKKLLLNYAANFPQLGIKNEVFDRFFKLSENFQNLKKMLYNNLKNTI